MTLTVTINGEPRTVSGPLTISDLVSVLGLDRRKVAIERNLEIVPRSTYDEVAVADGDRLEIVRFIGGG